MYNLGLDLKKPSSGRMMLHEQTAGTADETEAIVLEEATTVQDPELDYTTADLKQARHEILLRLNAACRSNPPLSIVSTIPYTNATLFVLCATSIDYESVIRAVLKNDARYSVEIRPITLDKVREEEAEGGVTQPNSRRLSDVCSVLPVTRRTLAIRRRAFKRLPRPPVRTFLYRTVLTVLIAIVIATIYNVLTG